MVFPLRGMMRGLSLRSGLRSQEIRVQSVVTCAAGLHAGRIALPVFPEDKEAVSVLADLHRTGSDGEDDRRGGAVLRDAHGPFLPA